MSKLFPDDLDFGTIVRPVLPMRGGRYVRDARVPEEKKAEPTLAISAGALREVDGTFLNWGFKTKVEPGETYAEEPAARVTEQVRIEDPDDPATYVDVERMKKAVFIEEKTKKRMILSFADWKTATGK